MRTRNTINGIFLQKEGSCQSAAMKTVVELKYFDKYGIKLDLDYYEFYKELKNRYGKFANWQHTRNALMLMKERGMYDKISKKYVKLTDSKKVYEHRWSWVRAKDIFKMVNNGEPLLMTILAEYSRITEVSENGYIEPFYRLKLHDVAAICGDTQKHGIWFANSWGVKAKGSDEGYYFIEEKKANAGTFYLIEEATQIFV
jgi:hypothetical protein